MTTQVKVRGATQTTQEARILTSRELDINTTDNRLTVHNGTTAGGIRHVTSFDQQNNEFNYASVAGTNSLTASMRVAPTSYVTGSSFFIKIANDNTGAVTLNINSLGAKSLRKIKAGSLVALEAGDLVAGALINVMYDGTYFQVGGGASLGFGKQAWIPNNVSSYDASKCVYVDYGDSVLVSYKGIRSSTAGVTSYIGNLPFDALNSSRSNFTQTGSNSTFTAEIRAGLNNLIIRNAFDNVIDDRGTELQGTITYIKE
jgi:hypothetical protein